MSSFHIRVKGLIIEQRLEFQETLDVAGVQKLYQM